MNEIILLLNNFRSDTLRKYTLESTEAFITDRSIKRDTVKKRPSFSESKRVQGKFLKNISFQIHFIPNFKCLGLKQVKTVYSTFLLFFSFHHQRNRGFTASAGRISFFFKFHRKIFKFCHNKIRLIFPIKFNLLQLYFSKLN